MYLRINVVSRRAAACILILQIRSVDYQLMKSVFHVQFIKIILTAHFLELGKYFMQFDSLKRKILGNRSLFDFHQSEIIYKRDDKTVKNPDRLEKVRILLK
jgi:hypothetical protein